MHRKRAADLNSFGHDSAPHENPFVAGGQFRLAVRDIDFGIDQCIVDAEFTVGGLDINGQTRRIVAGMLRGL